MFFQMPLLAHGMGGSVGNIVYAVITHLSVWSDRMLSCTSDIKEPRQNLKGPLGPPSSSKHNPQYSLLTVDYVNQVVGIIGFGNKVVTCLGRPRSNR